jgi:DNA-binding Lrp family transcriptional regulator
MEDFSNISSEVLESMLTQPGPIPIHERDKHGRNILFTAISGWSTICVSHILERGDSDPFKEDNYGWTPLHWAAFAYIPKGGRKERDVIQLLINRKGDDINALSSPAAQPACYSDKIPVAITPFDVLLGSYGTLIHQERYTRSLEILRSPKFDATRYNTAQFDLLLQYRSSFGSGNREEIIRMLFSRGFRPPLEKAIQDTLILKILLEAHENDVNREISALSGEKIVDIVGTIVNPRILTMARPNMKEREREKQEKKKKLDLLGGTTLMRRLPDMLRVTNGADVVSRAFEEDNGWISASGLSSEDKRTLQRKLEQVPEVSQRPELFWFLRNGGFLGNSFAQDHGFAL